MSGCVTFRDGWPARWPAPLDQVREVVRATGVETLTGARAPVTRLLELRGTPLPVVDLRPARTRRTTGDMLGAQHAAGRARPRGRPGASVLGPDDLDASPG